MKPNTMAEGQSVSVDGTAARDGTVLGTMLVVMSVPLVVFFALRGDWLWVGHFTVSASFGGLVRHEFPIRSVTSRVLLLTVVVFAAILAALGVMQALE